MLLFRTILFNLCLVLWTIFCAIFGAPFGISEKFAIKLGRFWAHGVLFLLEKICKITTDKDLKNLSQLSGVLVLSKHQSTWETIFLLSEIPNLIYVIKSSLLKIPFYGWYLRNMGMILINRDGGRREMQKMNNEILKAIKSGKNVVLFPQGTRNATKETKYKLGCLNIFKDFSGKLALIALNSGKYWSNSNFLKNPGKIKIVLSGVFDIDQNKEFLSKEFKEKIVNLIENTSNNL